MAGPARAIDLKLRLALRVAALAAVCFLAVAAYALVDSDRAARAKVSRIAEIVARDISLQQAQAHWFTLSSERTPDLQRVAAPLMEPGLCVAYQDKVGAFRQGICSGALAEEVAAPESYAALYRAIFHPGEPISKPLLIEGVTQEDAARLRDLILGKLRRSATAGLGDDEHHHVALATGAPAWLPEHLALLRDIRDDLASLKTV